MSTVQKIHLKPRPMFTNALIHKAPTGNLTRLQKRDCPYQLLNVNSEEDIEEQELEPPEQKQQLEVPAQARIRSMMNSQLKQREPTEGLDNSNFGVSRDFFQILQKERDLSFLDRLDKSQATSQLSLTQIFRAKNFFLYSKTAASTQHNTN